MTPQPEPDFTWKQHAARFAGRPTWNWMAVTWLALFSVWVIHHPHASNWWALALLGGIWLAQGLGNVFLKAAGLNKKGETELVHDNPTERYLP